MADHFPGFDTNWVVSLKTYHCQLRFLFEFRVRIKSLSSSFVVCVKILDVWWICLIVRESFLHVGNEHAKLSAPVSHVISSEHLAAHEFQNTANGFSDDCASEMTNMHFLRNIWRGEVHNNFALIYSRESEI